MAQKTARKKQPATLADVERGKERLLKSLAGLWATGSGIFTAYFSANGFSAFFHGDPMIEAFGWFMGFGVIFFQLYFYQGYTENKTMLLLSVGAFIYSVWTTWAGLMMGNADILYLQTHVPEALIKLFFALVIDLTAEPSLLFVLYGPEGLRGSDSLGRVLDILIPGDQSGLWSPRSFGGFGKKSKQLQTSRRNSSTSRGQTAYNQQTHTPSTRSSDVNKLRKQIEAHQQGSPR